MLTVLRRRDYALLWSGQLISNVGNWVFWIALPFYVYERTGSALATGAMLTGKELPPVLPGSLAGALVDRWDCQRVVVASGLLQALVLLLLLPGEMGLVYLAILCQSLTLLFTHPALGSLMPRLVGKHELMAANNLSALGGNLASLAGPALGGLLSGWLGLTGARTDDGVMPAEALPSPREHTGVNERHTDDQYNCPSVDDANRPLPHQRHRDTPSPRPDRPPGRGGCD